MFRANGRKPRAGDLEVVHDEGDSDGDGDHTANLSGKNLNATQLRLAIQGVVANDRNGNNSLVSTESRSGVELKLYKASLATSGANRGRAVKGAAVLDEDDNAMTAETDSDGIYAFTGLVEGQKYIVEAVNVAGSYMAVRNRGSLAVSGGDFDMVSQAYVGKAADFDPEFDGGTAPRWNHGTNKIENGGTANFALLWADGTAVGIVNDPSVRMAHEGANVELHRCLVDGDVHVDDDDGAFGEGEVDDTNAHQCRDLGSLDPSATASVNAKGEWEAEDLVEGMYEVTVDLPARYTHAKMDGTLVEPDKRSGRILRLSGRRAR